MKDLDLEAYVEAIESHLGQRRCREHTLSPRDFALARTWFGAGISLAAVLVALDEAFDSGQTAPSLAFCRRTVEAGAATARRKHPSP
jgi:hypothetical protein